MDWKVLNEIDLLGFFGLSVICIMVFVLIFIFVKLIKVFFLNFFLMFFVLGVYNVVFWGIVLFKLLIVYIWFVGILLIDISFWFIII